ncbi:hypothetical protein HK103_001598 [Boothiomyces macroporosus]|uniref:Nicotinamide/nicotinic acid mononucleotide adenylyltransferase 3 n=1 Tax=Boothiomyces macroporosus TaxID=261099 RepID=A0AAD5Y0T7_9FUNG|nr:hypothetical protein HK103_001598 [Boothiomyces macroporosus]
MSAVITRMNSQASPTLPLDYEFPAHKLKAKLKDTSKTPLVVVACGSYSPVTYLHLRMFEMAYDYIQDTNFEIIGGYFSPVSDAYAKPGLAPWQHRVNMCALACQDSTWIMVDSWEPSQVDYIRTAKVLDHFNEYLNKDGGLLVNNERKHIRIVLLAGGDLIQSFAVPNLWKEQDLYYILGGFGCLIIERTGANVHDFLLTNDSLFKNVWVVKQYIHNDISSTKIRLFIRRGMSIRYLLPDPVVDYIHQNGLYKGDFYHYCVVHINNKPHENFWTASQMDLETPKPKRTRDDDEATPTNKSQSPSFEFNAPQFHDFSQQEDKNPDNWFGNYIITIDTRTETPDLPEEKPKKEKKRPAPTKMKLRKRSLTHPMTLRKRAEPAAVQKKTKRGLTIPKPFNLSKTKSQVQPKSPFVPLAVKVSKFHQQTPARFKTKPAKKPVQKVTQNDKLTHPQSPFLTTKLRAQHNKPHVPSAAELEELELKKIQPFKAKPLNKRILELKDSLPQPAPLPLTIPQSPAIHKPQPKEIKPPSPKIIKANPVPDLSNPFKPEIEHRKIPVPEFHLPGDYIHEQKQREIQELKEKEEMELKKQREFKAHEPKLNQVNIADTDVPKPQPFNLETDKRGELYKHQLQEKLEQEQEELQKQAEFRAQPLPPLDPFLPKKSDKPLTEIQEFQSHLSNRQKERQKYEQSLKEKQQQEQELLEKMEKLKKVFLTNVGTRRKGNQEIAQANRS